VLARSSTATLEASNELLAHYGDTGDIPTQRAVDTLLDHAADALRALTDCLAAASGELKAAAAAACADTDRAGTPGTSSNTATPRSATADTTRVRARPAGCA